MQSHQEFYIKGPVVVVNSQSTFESLCFQVRGEDPYNLLFEALDTKLFRRSTKTVYIRNLCDEASMILQKISELYGLRL